MDQIPFVDLKAQNQELSGELQSAIDEVTQTAAFILGPAVERFEKSFARYCEAEHAVGLNNGTSALHLALLACGVGPGDEVITTPHSWISTSWAISYTGAKPIFVDIDPTTYNLDPSKVESAITPATKAILPVHLYGQSADLDPLLAIATEHGLTLIEDAAQAHGARYRGRRVGGLGKIGCFSFYPGKNLGAFGEGGAIVTQDAALAERIRRMRDHAQQGRHVHVELGFNMRMEGLQGAVLDVKLRHLDRWNAARASRADRYRELLAGVPGLILPAPEDPASHVWHLYVVRVLSRDRDSVRAALAERGVQTGVHYPTPIPLQPVYASLGHRAGDFPVAEAVMSSCISLPMYPQLEDEQVERVATSLREVLSS